MAHQDPYQSFLDTTLFKTTRKLQDWVEEFLEYSRLQNFESDLRRGALLVQHNVAFKDWETVNDEERLSPRNAQTLPNKPRMTQREEKYLRSEHGLARDNLSRKSSGKLPDLMKSLKQYYDQKSTIHALVACCSIGAAIQGWDEAVINGAQIYYRGQDGFQKVKNDVILGLLNSAPYLMCIFSCLLTEPLNHMLGRKGTIMFTCFFSFASCLGQAFVKHWWQLLILRLLLGFGIGPKTATIPIYAAESVPQLIRGAMVMQWQLWTALGIMAGLTTSYIVQDMLHEWRYMLGSPMIPAAVLLLLMLSMPESPRWHILKARQAQNAKKRHIHYEKAFLCLWRLRHTSLQAGRDLIMLDRLIELEINVTQSRQKQSKWTTTKSRFVQGVIVRYKALWANLRCRRAMIATLIVMVWQQLCGVNVLTYYSNSVFLRTNQHPVDGKLGCNSPYPIDKDSAKSDLRRSFGFSMGLGGVNFGLALPALLLIDTVGRRSLLLLTFPFMALSYYGAALSYIAKECYVQTTLVKLFCYVFLAFYSVGEGPVPLVYAAESLPLALRDTGVGLATAMYWGFNFMLAMTWPSFYDARGISTVRHGVAFAFYATLCLIGFVLILLFVPETKRIELEKLDLVFSRTYKYIMDHGKRELLWVIKKLLCFKDPGTRPNLVRDRESPAHRRESTDGNWVWEDEVGRDTEMDSLNNDGRLSNASA